MLRSLLNGIRKLSLDVGETTWSEYSPTTSYNQTAAKAKEEFITQIMSAARPRQVLDIGCNDGYYSSVALKAGATSVIGFEGDRGALDRAYVRAVEKGLNFLPLFIDMSNPTPRRKDGRTRNARVLPHAPKPIFCKRSRSFIILSWG